jgi:hypothetical protein
MRRSTLTLNYFKLFWCISDTFSHFENRTIQLEYYKRRSSLRCRSLALFSDALYHVTINIWHYGCTLTVGRNSQTKTYLVESPNLQYTPVYRVIYFNPSKDCANNFSNSPYMIRDIPQFLLINPSMMIFVHFFCYEI